MSKVDVSKLVKIDLPGLSPEVEKFLLERELKFYELEYSRYLSGCKITEELVDKLVKDAVDTHCHGGSEPIERLLLEDDIAVDYTRAGLRAVVIKTHFSPSASRVPLVQRFIVDWAGRHDLRPVRVLGGICLNHAVGGLNPQAVRAWAKEPGCRYVWLPSIDSYHHYQVVHGQEGKGIRILDDNGRLLPQMREILKIVADNDLVLATGHYPHEPDKRVLVEEAIQAGVRRIENQHAGMPLHCKSSTEQIKEFSKLGVKHGITALVPLVYNPPEGYDYLVRLVSEVGPDHFVFGTDFGQVQNPAHLVGVRWFVKYMLAYGPPLGIRVEQIKGIMTRGADLIGLRESIEGK